MSDLPASGGVGSAPMPETDPGPDSLADEQFVLPDLDADIVAADTEALLEQATAALSGGGEQRTGQRDMAIAVARAIADGRHLVVEAGTGTGKSLAYLTPVLASGLPTVIATATKALQDQLATKELPHLHALTNRAFSFAVLKGRSNYICLQRVNEHRSDQLRIDGTAGQTADEIDDLVAWSDTTETGDRSELDFEPVDAAWAAVSVTSAECPGATRCPVGQACFAEQARRRAAEADVVVVNTHLLGLDVFTEGQVLPDHPVLIVDEAHQLEDVITATCGVSISESRFSSLGRTVAAIVEDADTTKDLEQSGLRVGNALAPDAGKRLADGVTDDLADAFDLAIEQVNDVAEMLRNLPKPSDPDAASRRDRAVKATMSLQADLVYARHCSDDQVVWVEDARRGPVLRVAPLDVSSVVAGPLWEHKHSVILTSATLDGSVAPSLGMPAGTTEQLNVESPFDYQSNALLYCAKDLPEPRSPDYQDEMLRLLEKLIVAAGGRTLALFTSWRMMEAAFEHLEGRLATPIFTQRDLPKPALIEAFSADEASSLFATMGFWQGIDVPGPSLSLVTIDRLPFPRPDDPLLSARREAVGGRAFGEVDLPRATTQLAQGVGRLMRSKSDRGVVAILDRRLATNKSYRWRFIERLPPMARTGELDVALDRLRSLRDA